MDGEWKYLTNTFDGGTSQGWVQNIPPQAKQIIIPDYVNKFELPKQSGSVWAWREFVLPARWKSQTMRLRFGAVSLHSTFWIDGEKIGEHEGGSLPFEWNITSHATPGKNQLIAVRIQGTMEHGVGIWQHVDIVAHDEAYLADCFPQGGSTGDITAKVQIYNSSNNSGDSTLDIKIFQPGDKPKDIKKTNQNLGVTPGVNLTTINSFYPAKKLKLWSPASPNIYRIGLSFRQDLDVLDTMEVPFGFRDIDYDMDGLKLNGKNVKLSGINEMPVYPRTFSTDDDMVRAREIMRRLKDKQVNIILLRAPHPEIIQIADEEGILVVESVMTDQTSKSRVVDIHSLIERDRAHPCIIAWNAIGLDDSELKALRDLDQSRIVISGDSTSPLLWLPGQHTTSSFAVPIEFLPSPPSPLSQKQEMGSIWPNPPAPFPAHTNDKAVCVREGGASTIKVLPSFRGTRELGKGARGFGKTSQGGEG